jgi:RNA polymerase sigma factor (sigma-70 family)
VSSQNKNYLTDERLVNSVLCGDKKAFGLIIKQTEGLVAMIVFKMIPNSDDRKDIAQDIYLKAFNKLSGFQFKSKLSTWIGQIAYNTCLHYLEKKKLTLVDDLTSHEILIPGTHPDFTETILFKKELSGILQTEIEQLPPVYKTLVTLFHLEELSYEELAQITALPQGTIKSYLFRARKILKDNLLAKYKKEDL